MSRHVHADLVADLSAELAAPRPVAAPAPARRTVPALSVVLTPLHWSRPSVGLAATGVVLRGGPWQVEVRL